MRRHAAPIALLLVLGCGDGEEQSIAVCDPGAGGPFSLTIDNPYLPLVPGETHVLEGIDEGELVRLEIEVLDEHEIVGGAATRVVVERESVNGELVEVSRNFIAQAADGTVCYFGEDVDIYEDGEIVSHEGAWRAGEGANQAGILMPGDPQVGMRYAQEVAPGVASDRAEIVRAGEPLAVAAGTFADTIETLESSPLEPGVTETKVYVRGIGLALDGVLELVEGAPQSGL
jgi:hypothetical protein